MTRLEVPGLVGFRHQQQRTVDGHHLVQKYRDVHGARLRHAIIAFPGAVILMPLPDLAREGGFGVDLELMHINRLAKELLDWPDHARMFAEDAKSFVIKMGGKSRARRPAFLAPDLGPLFGVDCLRLAFQERYFLRRK